MTLRDYIKRLTKKELAEFCKRAGTTPSAVRWSAYGYRSGGVPALSPAHAAALVDADQTGILKIEELSPTCAACKWRGP